MDNSLLDSERIHKLNDWGAREPLVCSDRDKIDRAQCVKIRQDLSNPEKSTLYIHELSGCNGFEFVGFSNAKLERPVRLASDIILFPCFMQTTVGCSLKDPIVQASFRMSQTGCYVYDGWLPINELNDEEIRARIRTLREVLGSFALISGSKFDWEPKYPMTIGAQNTHYYSEKEINTLEGLAETIEISNQSDRIALLRSIGWISECARIENSESKFLLAVLAIESLCTYIEESGSESAFHELALNKKSRSERKEEREECIRQTFADGLEKNPTKAVSSAYFDCIVGIKKRLHSHLLSIFGEEDEDLMAFFIKPNGNPSLYELRHTIAHGSHDILSEFDRNGIDKNIYKVEKLAHRYVWHVLNHCLGFFNESSSVKAKISIDLGSGIISSRSMYKGPTDMGLIYVK